MDESEGSWNDMPDSDDNHDPSRPLISSPSSPKGDATPKDPESEPIAGGPRVEYIYEPVYPRTGGRQDAVGLIGKTRRVSWPRWAMYVFLQSV
jgi:hypothetical protein